MKPRLSIVTPACNEAANLPELHRRIVAALEGCGLAWEWIAVDDHSEDETFAVLTALARQDARVRGVRLARNSGAHAALLCGLAEALGEAAVVLAADLQDPPEIVPELLARWRGGAQVVWAAREDAPAFSRLYYRLLRRLGGLERMPPAGADFFLVERAVIDALQRCGERHTNVFALLLWIGFRQETVTYAKQARRAGRSGWTWRKKIRLVLDSLTAFTHAPLRLMSLLGVATALVGFFYAVVVIANALAGRPPAGWSSLMVVVLVLGGAQMTMMGVLGEYLWRALDEARRRPRFLIEARTPPGEGSGDA